MRKTIQVLLNDTTKKSITVTEELLKQWLGHAKFKKTSLDQSTQRTGLATGLAWTEMGGDVLEIEATILPGKGGLTLTGQLGDVMQESAHAALSYIRSRATELGLKSSFYSSKDIHLHIPEGATPKDGPSAGITMCVALVSALTKNLVKPLLAMTGEITLRGRVLAVGGLKEKLLAARHHAIKTVILPQENKEDIEEILREIGTQDLEIIFVENMDQVLTQALVKNPFVTTLKEEKHKKARTSRKHKKTK
jgi:ATP-dependent Lon protease